MIDISKIKVGDRITFRSWTREGTRKAARKVNYVSSDPFCSVVGVRYFGCSSFRVFPDEIIEHHPKEEA